MYEAYYKEMNPEKRMKILNELKESADEKEWELRKRLFDIRYTKTKRVIMRMNSCVDGWSCAWCHRIWIIYFRNGRM